MGTFRRTITGWKRDLLGAWGKLKTFHRIVLGIALGMVLIYVSRQRILDPLQMELVQAELALEKKGVPLVVPLPKDDPEIQEITLKLESLRKSAPKWKRQKEEAIQQRPQVDRKNRSDVHAEFEKRILASGMTLKFRSPYQPDADAKSGDSVETPKKQ